MMDDDLGYIVAIFAVAAIAAMGAFGISYSIADDRVRNADCSTFSVQDYKDKIVPLRCADYVDVKE